MKPKDSVSGKAAQVSPPHQPIVFFPPGGTLIRGIGNDAGRTQFTNRTLNDGSRLARRKHQLAANLFAFVIAVFRASPDVDECCRNLARQAVLRQRQRHRVPVAEPAHTFAFRKLPQFCRPDVPDGPGLLRSEHRIAIGRVFLHLDILQAVMLELVEDMSGSIVKLFACPHTMLQRNRIEISFGGLARCLFGNLLQDRFVHQFPNIGMRSQ